MNYIWELAIEAKKRGIDIDSIQFYEGKPFSGYMELSFTHMNETNIFTEIEINPYYRYHKIFKKLLDPCLEENEEMIQAIFDLCIHHLLDIDLLMGMSRREYYIEFLLADMKKGYFGEYIQEKLDLFTVSEQKIIINNLIKLYDTGEILFLLKDTVSRIFTDSYIFCNAEEKDEITFYLRTSRTKEKEEKLIFLQYLFLPFQYEVIICWENIFGLIGIDDFMRMEEIMSY